MESPIPLLKSSSITFYVGGPLHRLRQLWKYLATETGRLILHSKKTRLIRGTETDVVKVEVPSPICL